MPSRLAMPGLQEARAPGHQDPDHQLRRLGSSADDHGPAAGHQTPGSQKHHPLGDPAYGSAPAAEQSLHRQDLALRL